MRRKNRALCFMGIQDGVLLALGQITYSVMIYIMHIKKINEYYIWRKGWLIKVKEGYIVIRNLIKPKATSHSLDGRFL